MRVIDPQTAPDALTFTDADQIDAGICQQQPLFASPEAARHWLDRRPGGQVIAVAELQRRIKRLLN